MRVPSKFLDEDAKRDDFANAKLIELASVTLSSFRAMLREMTNEDRHEFLFALLDGYCDHCGSPEPKDANGFTRFCVCLKDE